MKIFKYYILILSLFISTYANAQSPSPREEAEIMLKVVELFENYQRYCAIDENFRNYRDYFIDLFKDTSSKVYNDIPGIAGNGINEMSAKEYANLLQNSSSTTRVEVKNIKKESVRFVDNSWLVVCSFDKYVNVTNGCDIEYASDFLNGRDYHLTATIVYDVEGDICHFKQIEGEGRNDDILSYDYRVIKCPPEVLSKLTYNKKPVVANAMGQSFITFDGKFAYKDPDAKLKLVELNSDCNLWSLKVQPKPFRLKVHYSMGLGSPFNLSGGNELNNLKSSANNLGIDWGYVFPSSKKIKFGTFVGCGLTNYTIDMSINKPAYIFETDQDIDGDSYMRQYHDLSINQSNKITEITIPVYFEMDWHFSNIVSFFVDMGAQLNMNLSHSIKKFEGKASAVDGIYTQYENLLLDYQWGYNGFTQNLNLMKSNLCRSERVVINSFVPDLLVGGGFRINIPNTPLAIDLGVEYNKSFDSMISISNKSGLNENENHLVYNKIEGLQNKECVHDLFETMESITRNLLKFNFGLTFKF